MNERIKICLQLIGWFAVLAFIFWIPQLAVVMFPFMIGWWIWKKIKKHRL